MLVSSVTCGNCGADCPEKDRFCAHCGTALYRICSHCGRKNAQSSAHCSHCNAALQSKNPVRWEKPAVASGRPLERRQLTIMFTDLVDSTGLADSMDPEDFLALIEAHRTIAVAPITRLGGVVARYLGDGMLVLFGYPEAHEDNPERAVRAGLEVARATTEMNQRWVGEGKGRIAVRIGIHTGIVVVGDVLKADVQELMAVFGNTPSIASRLQGLAQPNSVVLSGATKALLPEAIRCESRGNVTLKGLKRPIEIFSALEVREGEGDRRPAGRVLPFVNREQELATIRQHWAAAKGGEGSCLTIQGEPGIGKSRLIRAVQERIVTPPSRWLITRTSPYAANTDFFAISELFRRLLASDAATTDLEPSYAALEASLKHQGLDDANLTIGLARLIGIDIPEDATATLLQPERARELTLAAITKWLQHESRKQPLVLVIEDLHWADASTLEALDRLKPTLPNHSLLLLCTTRGATRTSLTGVREDSPVTISSASEPLEAVKEVPPTEVAPASPASAAGTDGTVVILERLRAESAADLLGHVLQGVDLPKESVTTLLERANGVPLYLEELPKPVLEAGGQTQDTSITVPATLRDSLMAQLDRMGEAKAIAQTAAVLGHSFERPLLEHVWDGNKQTLHAGLDTLTDAALITPERDNYGFRHALLAEIAYDTLLRDERRRIHRRTADILVNHFHRIAETRPDILARHYEACGESQKALDYWLKAGNAAASRSAYAEAQAHLRNAEVALTSLKESGIDGLDEQLLALLMAKGPVLSALFGSSSNSVETNYIAAQEIFRRIGMESRGIINTWPGLYNTYILKGDVSRSLDILERVHEIAVSMDDNDMLSNWCVATGYCDFLRGRFGSAINHAKKSDHLRMKASPEAIYNVKTLVISGSFKAWALWFLGKSNEARASSILAVRTAEEANHPLSLCHARGFASSLAQCRGDVDEAYLHANATLNLSAEHMFPYWCAWARMVKGWALAASGEPERGVSMLKQGISEYRETGAAQMRTYALCLLAEALLKHDRPQEVVDTAKLAITEAERTSISFYQPEAFRLLGEGLARNRSGSTDVIRAFLSAIRLAQRQGSLLLQLKGLCSMARNTPRDLFRVVGLREARNILPIIAQNCSQAERIYFQRLIDDSHFCYE